MSLRLNLMDKHRKNMTVLKSFDAEVIDIIAEATHISIYEFDALSTSWKRFGVEGAAFITKRSSFPECKLIVLNKQGLDNFSLDLNCVNKMKIQIISKLILSFRKFKKIILRMKILLINLVYSKIKRMQIYMRMMNLKIFKEL